MPESLLAPTFLFRFSVPCLWAQRLWSAKGISLGKRHILPSFGELENRPLFADVRAAWNESGLAFTVRVLGKNQQPWGRVTRVEDSDGLHVWIDTRDMHSIHRATRFCHYFVFLPFAAGVGNTEPAARLLVINRARNSPKPIDDKLLRVRSEKRVNGYVLQAFIPAGAMTGFDPTEHDRLGFTYAVTDRELGQQSFTVGPEFPFAEDPSLWGTLELCRDPE